MQKIDCKAVSPVIGVMLMLVVTVLLAAAVSSYTGSLQTEKPAPSAVFDVKIVKNGTTSMGKVSYMEIKQISGDKIPTKDLKIITYNPDAHGTKTIEVLPCSGNTHYYYTYYNSTSMEWDGKWKNGTSPYLNDMSKGFFGNNPPVDFGNYTTFAGITMTADLYDNYQQDSWNGTAYNPGTNVTGFCACIADGWNVTPGHYITVKIVYLPANTVIWQKNVMVEGEGL